MIPPNDFIPIAEESGIILEINKWVLKTACWQHTTWRKSGLPLTSITENVLMQETKETIIAEGIEPRDQFALIRPHGCDQGQGYYFSPPVPADRFTILLEQEYI